MDLLIDGKITLQQIYENNLLNTKRIELLSYKNSIWYLNGKFHRLDDIPINKSARFTKWKEGNYTIRWFQYGNYPLISKSQPYEISVNENMGYRREYFLLDEYGTHFLRISNTNYYDTEWGILTDLNYVRVHSSTIDPSLLKEYNLDSVNKTMDLVINGQVSFKQIYMMSKFFVFNKVSRIEVISCLIKDDSTEYFKNGRHHRLDGPARITRNEISWFRDGFLHRDKNSFGGAGPALVRFREECWYEDGVLHRIDGPALIINNMKYWYINGSFKFKKPISCCDS